ncbi:MAG: hypothetical protein H7323_16650 [Frankiales bacterium]|nr:hypothetical protein [Frankiales bacterium]
MTAAADLGFPVVTARSRAASARVGIAPVARRRPALSLVVPRRTDAPRAPFVAVIVSLLVAGLLGLLGLNTALAQDAFALHTLTQDGTTLADREQSLAREVEALRSPDALAARANALGMVPAGPPAFLRLPDGAILGSPVPGLPPGATLGPNGEVIPGPTPVVATNKPGQNADTAAATTDAPAATTSPTTENR